MDETTAAVISAADEIASEQAQARERTGEVRLSTGVLIRVRPVPQAALLRLRSKFREPQVPMWTNPEKGRTEENPSDPDYLAALAQYRADVGTAAINLFVLLGTELAFLPPGMDGPDGAAWLEERALLGLASGDSPRALYFDWLTLRAAPEQSDMQAIMQAVGRASGTREADVQAALKSARSHTARG